MEHKEKKQRENIIILICLLVIIGCFVLFAIISANNRTRNRFQFNEHLEDDLLTITIEDDTYTYSIKDISYYILLMEASINHSANVFNPNNLYSLWNIKTDGKFLKDLAKEDTMALFIRDNLYYIEAVAHNITLDQKELDIVQDEASQIYKSLTGKQVDATKLTLEDLYNIRYKINLITKYIYELMNTDGYTEDELHLGGSHYDTLFNKYSIKIHEIWNEIELGNITITRDLED